MPNPKVVTHFHYQGKKLWMSEGKIVAPADHSDQLIDLEDLYLAPGYIDLQVNGAFGIDLTQEPEKVHEVARQLPRFGVTAFLPTLISSPKKTYRHAIPVLREAMKKQTEGEATILGIHLEGPFFHPEMARAHNPAYLQPCSEGLEIYGDLEGVKMVTLAPELPGALPLISALHQRGIIVSAGHSTANAAQLKDAIHYGLCCATHLFNAMPPFHHRQSGLVGAILAHPILPFTVISDPHHLDPQALQIAWRCGPNRMILISDAMAGLAAAQATLGSQSIELAEGKALLAGTQTLAGSTQPLDAGVRYLCQSTGCPTEMALEAASLRPAQLLHLPYKGTLNVGADADLIALDANMTVTRCWINGKEIKTK